MIQIYTCYHKPFTIPNSDILVPIHVGKELSSVKMDIIGDNTGDNISQKNPYYCELTATYWIWKNATADIVGLFHYRRFLNFANDETSFCHFGNDFCQKYGITAERVSAVLADYDVVLPKVKRKRKNPLSIYEHYKEDHIGTDMDCVLQVIDEKYPDVSATAREVIKNGVETYITNILVCRKDIFDKYAAWLFGVLFEVEKRIQENVLTRDSYQQRVYGFLAERMMTIFIRHMQKVAGLKVKELPSLYYEDDAKRWRKYKLRRLKRKILHFFGLRRDADA